MPLRIRMPALASLTGIVNFLRFGVNTPSAFYVGNNPVTRMYFGSTQIYG